MPALVGCPGLGPQGGMVDQQTGKDDGETVTLDDILLP